jgi:hypothetical protein
MHDFALNILDKNDLPEDLVGLNFETGTFVAFASVNVGSTAPGTGAPS